MSDLVGEIDIILRENKQLREQNRVLRQALLKVKPELYCMDKQLIASGYKRGASVADAMRSLEAALTATSQPVSEKGDYSHHPAFDEYGEHR